MTAGELVTGADKGVVAALRGFVDKVRSAADEVVPVLVEGAHELIRLVPLDRVVQIPVALRVHVVCPYEDALLSRGHCERSDTRHNVTHHLSGLELVDEPRVFVLELGVPVDFCVVELEDAVVLLDLDVEVVGPREDFVAESSELGFLADVVDLVDDGAEARRLV